jgi:glycosyltransferase involved in cell wall biosynthesis
MYNPIAAHSSSFLIVLSTVKDLCCTAFQDIVSVETLDSANTAVNGRRFVPRVPSPSPTRSTPRVLITHDFFETFGGAERVTAEIAEAFPDATVYAILGRKSVARRMGIADRYETLLPERPWLLQRYRTLAPLFPALVRQAQLPEADLVIASSYAYSHGFRTPNRAPVLCYSHGPLRHLWSQQSSYAAELPGAPLVRGLFNAYAKVAREADRAASRSVASYITQSPYTASLIARAYGREAELLPPPVACDVFRPSGRPSDGYFLFVGRLVEAYKRPSVVIDAFAEMPDLKLRVVGDGPAREALQKRATPNVEFLGRLDDGDLVPVMQSCEAAVFPSVDDFGLVPLEVNACGRPVLALGEGGALHTVAPGVSGEFLADQTAAAVVRAVRAFDPGRYQTAAIRQHAMRWHSGEFQRRLREMAQRTLGRATAP